MEELLIYLMKVAGVSSLFYLVYFLLLKNETSFRLNRIFLFSGLAISVLLPLLNFTRTINVDAPEVLRTTAAGVGITSQISGSGIDWWQIFFYLYLAGMLFFLSKMAFQLLNLFLFLRKGKSFEEDSFTFIETEEQLQPFSFFRTVIFNPNLHSSEELQMIFQHEKAHGRQYHSIDVLFVNIFAALLWFFPLVWLYKKSIVQNLEYLADQSTVAASIPVKAYQKVLVKVSVGDLQPALVNSFYQSLIKKRIIMLNKKSSEKTPFWKVSLIFPLLVAFVLLFNVKTVAQVKQQKERVAFTMNIQDQFVVAINPQSSQEELEDIVDLAEEKGIDLKFSNIKRNAEALITNIEAKFKNKDLGQSGSYSLNDEKGITPFIFYLDDKGNSGFRTTNTMKAATFVRTEPGKVYSFSHTTDDKSKAVTIYADTLNFTRAPQEGTRIFIKKDSTDNNMRTFYFTESKSVNHNKPLIVVDGKEMSDSYNLNQFDPEEIDSVNVLKGPAAVEKYGEKAEGGAIEINLKKDRE